MKSKVALVIILLLPIVYIWLCNRNQKKIEQSSFNFPGSLTALGFFKDKLSDLSPAKDVILYELSATLFTDYAEKQRLLKLPKGTRMTLKGDGLPVFPEGTLIAKTFFYQTTPKKKQIVETRILFLKKGKWHAGTYKWNKEQNEAYYTAKSSVVPVEIPNKKGEYRHIKYRIPSAGDCQSCHRSMDEIVPIGPKGMNINRTVSIKNQAVNQIEYFKTLGIVNSDANVQKIMKLSSYENDSVNLARRARAYLEINCAHCHNPGGIAYQKSVMFDYQTPLQQSGIAFNKSNIVDRMRSMGPYHMPKLGTTVIDEEGVELIKDYIKSLPK